MPTDPFVSFHLAGITLRNRLVRSATHEGLADARGLPTDALARKYLQLAKGGIGAIITGYAGVQAAGRCAYHRMLMMDRDQCVTAYRALVSAVHAENTPIILQLGHAGRQTRSRVTGIRPVAPSALRDRYFDEDVPRELSEPEIQQIIASFCSAAVRAQAAGFDAVQLHAAHGYLLSEFLSPYMNRRTDAWGGTTERRFRILGEILDRIAGQCPGFPVLVKLNATDRRPGGMRLAEAIVIAQMLENAGCAAIEVSRGVYEDGFYFIPSERNPVDAVFRYSFKMKRAPRLVRPLLKPFLRYSMAPRLPTRLYNVEAAQAIKSAVKVPVMVVGGIRTKADIQSILDAGQADLVSLCRPLILEPSLVHKFRLGKQTEAKCLGCNYCALGIEEAPLRCHFGKIRAESAEADSVSG